MCFSGFVLSGASLGYAGCSSDDDASAKNSAYTNVADGNRATCVPLHSGRSPYRLDIELTFEKPNALLNDLTFDIIGEGLLSDDGLYWFAYSITPGHTYNYQECQVEEQQGRHRVLCKCGYLCDRIFLRFEQYIEGTTSVPRLCEVEQVAADIHIK